MRKSKNQAQGVDFDFGTSPHGLSAELHEAEEKDREAENVHSLADQQGAAALRKPVIYWLPEVRRCCRQVRGANLAASAQALRQGRHTLRLDDREFMYVVSAIERTRNKIRNAVCKGKADFEDLQATDSLWQKLQVLRSYRMRGAR